MSRFELKDLENYNESDVFIIDKNTAFNLDTSAHSIFKLQQFLNTYKNFEHISPTLSEKADVEFLNIMLNDQDVNIVLNDFRKKYKFNAIMHIIQTMFAFWFKQATGQELPNLNDDTKK